MLGLRNGLRCFTFDTGEVFEGEWVDFKRSGFGMQWDKDGTLLHCGHWADNVVDTRPVPRSKIPVGTHLSAAGERHSRANNQTPVAVVDQRT